MLVVLSEDGKRASSGALSTKFQEVYSKCLGTSGLDYCMKGIPRPMPGFARSATAVQAILNENAKKTMKDNPPDMELEIHAGKLRKSMPEKDLENIDGI